MWLSWRFVSRDSSSLHSCSLRVYLILFALSPLQSCAWIKIWEVCLDSATPLCHSLCCCEAFPWEFSFTGVILLQEIKCSPSCQLSLEPQQVFHWHFSAFAAFMFSSTCLCLPEPTAEKYLHNIMLTCHPQLHGQECVFKGVSAPVVWFIWSESVDELQLICIFPSVRFGFTQARFQGNQSVSTKAHGCWNHVSHISSPSAVC